MVIAISALFFALMAAMARTLATEVPLAQLVVLRHCVGLSGMVLYFVSQRRWPSRKRPGLLLLRGLFGALAVLGYFTAIRDLGAAPATVLNYTAPVYAVVFAALFLKERPTPLAVTGLVMATVGAALVAMASGASERGHDATFGAVAGLVSGVFGGAAMAAMKAAREDVDAATVFLAFCVVGLVFSVPLASGTWISLEFGVWLRAMAVGVFALVGQLLFTWGMGYTSATVGSATTQLVPVFSWVLALGVLGETVTVASVFGALLCVGGVLLGLIPRWHPNEAKQPEAVLSGAKGDPGGEGV